MICVRWNRWDGYNSDLLIKLILLNSMYNILIV